MVEYTDLEDGAMPDPADLVAELDDEPDADQDDADTDQTPPETYTGTARGGPLDGRTVQIRCPKGFLLIDRPQRQVWIYDRGPGGALVSVSDQPETLDDDKRWQAADGDEYDILVPDMETDGGTP